MQRFVSVRVVSRHAPSFFGDVIGTYLLLAPLWQLCQFLRYLPLDFSTPSISWEGNPNVSSWPDLPNGHHVSPPVVVISSLFFRQKVSFPFFPSPNLVSNFSQNVALLRFSFLLPEAMGSFQRSCFHLAKTFSLFPLLCHPFPSCSNLDLSNHLLSNYFSLHLSPAEKPVSVSDRKIIEV